MARGMRAVELCLVGSSDRTCVTKILSEHVPYSQYLDITTDSDSLPISACEDQESARSHGPSLETTAVTSNLAGTRACLPKCTALRRSLRL